MKLCQEIGCIERGFGCVTHGGSIRIYCYKHYEENLYDIIALTEDDEFDEQDNSDNERLDV